METVNVLLVEDIEDDYLLTKGLLEDIHPDKYHIDWVSTYSDAVAAIRLITHDVCLLDFRLSGHTGLELLTEICATECDIPIIVLTGQSDTTLDLRVMQAGASDYLIKGELNPTSLERAIRYAIQQKRTQVERIKLAREKEARIAAEIANQAKDEFLAIVSHELRSPLNSMLGWVKLMRSKKLNEAVFEKGLETIERGVRTQAKLIEDLLDISRIVSGNLKLKITPVNPVAIINAAISLIQPLAVEKQISIHSRLQEDVKTIKADSDRLQQVVSNLLSNAVKFTSENGKIEVILEQTDKEIKIIVKDTGRGINKEFLPHVFDRYKQADTSTTRQHSGLGLGLAIVHHIVELHGGTVTADSLGEGQGATFTIVLPIKTDAPKPK